MPNRLGEPDPHPTGRASAVNVFRAVVCLEIVGMHAFHGNLGAQVGPAVGWAVAHLRFGYESFFVLAGYFLAHAFRPGEWSYLSVAAFVRRRLIRLALPYWVAIVFGVAGFELSAWVRGRHYNSGGLPALWPTLLFAQDLVPVAAADRPWVSPSVVYWFMAPLFQYYLLWAAAFWAVRRWHLGRDTPEYHDRTLRAMTGLTVAAMAGSLACVAAGGGFRWALATDAVYLAVGCLAYWAAHGRPARFWLAAGVAGLVGVGAWHGQSRPLAAAVTACLLPALTRQAGGPSGWPARCLAFVGERSYSIYLTHTYIAYRMLNWSWGFSGRDSLAAALTVWSAAVGASVAFGALVYALVERPTARIARGVQFRGGPARG
jgi:peptidoglycan/LPS O-acetylase OafA/YrhL